MSNQSLQIYTAEINDDRYPGAGFNEEGEMENRGLARSRASEREVERTLCPLSLLCVLRRRLGNKCEAGGNILCVITFVGRRYGDRNSRLLPENWLSFQGRGSIFAIIFCGKVRI